MNIDEETNLKVKQGLEVTSSLLHEDSDFKDFKALVRCEDPNINLYVFVGTLALEEERSIARDSSGDPVLQQRLIQEDNVSKTMNPIELIQSRPRAFILLLGLTHGLIRRPRVCILGGGFGGLYTALRLESLVWPDDKKPQVVLVDQSERFVFKPMMYELLSGEVDAWEIAPRFSANKHMDPISPR